MCNHTGKPGIVFEMQMGMIDRGAELKWISQYPHEEECLFAPLVRTPLSIYTFAHAHNFSCHDPPCL